MALYAAFIIVISLQGAVFAQDSGVPDMPYPMVGMCSARIEDKLYFIGGAQGLQGKNIENLRGTSIVQAFDFENMRWDTNVAPLMTPRVFACAVVMNDSIYVMGGVDSLGHVLNSVEVYDPATNTWRYGSPMLMASKGAAATVFDDHIFIFGGGNGMSGPTSQVEVYSSDAGRWKSTYPMVFGRAYHKVIRVKGLMYIVGGVGGSVGPISIIETYVPTVGTTSIALTLKRPRMLFGTVENGDSVFVISGMGGSGGADNHIELLNLATEGGERDSLLMNTVDSARVGFVAAKGNDGKIYLFGGVSPDYKNEQVAVPTVTALGEITDVKQIPNTIPQSFSLGQNYPNPFNPTTNIHFDIPSPGSDVSLEVYNMLGESVKTLVKGYLRGGSYVFTFDGANLPSGAYIYRLETPKGSTYRKMVLIK